MFNVRSSWISNKISELSDHELLDLFREIYDFRENGILKGELLRNLEAQVAQVTLTRGGEMMRMVEDAVLFEMSRRFANQIEEKAEKEDYTNIRTGDTVYYAEPGMEVERGIVSSVNYQPDDDTRPKDLFVDFGDDCDGFDGSALGFFIFTSHKAAEQVANRPRED